MAGLQDPEVDQRPSQCGCKDQVDKKLDAIRQKRPFEIQTVGADVVILEDDDAQICGYYRDCNCDAVSDGNAVNSATLLFVLFQFRFSFLKEVYGLEK